MCGITITSCTKKINLSSRVKPEEIKFYVDLVIKKKKDNHINKLFELAKNYKSDVNFLNYFKFSRERKQIHLCIQILKKFVNKNKNFENSFLEKNEKILDILWFF